MVVDIQGVKNTLTDPQIHSQDIDRFGRGNLSCKGMDAFFCNHVCNDICQTLKLQPNPHQSASVLPDEFSRALGSIAEDEVPEDDVESVPQAVDWMPIRGTALGVFFWMLSDRMPKISSAAHRSCQIQVVTVSVGQCLSGKQDLGL